MWHLAGRVCSLDPASSDSVDPPATNDNVAVVENSGLSGCDGRLGIDELELRRIMADRAHAAGGRAMTMADLCGRRDP
jgi:hypothetical protein